ncbi:PIN domain-containing protein [Treponema primitia]|uniref:PIN domain-containing protein n=1 Tax=Treponema primitia TaxID=88058 RepID=UPI000255589B|nr:PIN domain-containing protein [Treponema primitia]
MNKVFIDSNILVYSLDKNSKEKQKIVRETLNDIEEKDAPVISTQVLQEVYNITTTKLKMEKLYVKNILNNYKKMEIVQVDFDIIQQGIDISILSKISFWDGLIIAAAASANCGSVLSEDMNHGQIIRGVRVVNPFM